MNNFNTGKILRYGLAASLLTAKAVSIFKKKLLPLASVVTPNLYEAGVLSGLCVKTPADMKEIAKRILKLGPKAVVIKGGHLKGEALDFVYDGKKSRVYKSKKLSNKHTHGTGCTFSAVLTAELAKGRDLWTAAASAKKFISMGDIYHGCVGMSAGG